MAAANNGDTDAAVRQQVEILGDGAPEEKAAAAAELGKLARKPGGTHAVAAHGAIPALLDPLRTGDQRGRLAAAAALGATAELACCWRSGYP